MAGHFEQGFLPTQVVPDMNGLDIKGIQLFTSLREVFRRKDPFAIDKLFDKPGHSHGAGVASVQQQIVDTDLQADIAALIRRPVETVGDVHVEIIQRDLFLGTLNGQIHGVGFCPGTWIHADRA